MRQEHDLRLHCAACPATCRAYCGRQDPARREDLLTKSESEMREIRGKKIAMILQDPLMSLNPVYTIGNQVSESFKLHGEKVSRSSIRKDVIDVLTRVKIPSAAQRLKDYPFQSAGDEAEDRGRNGHRGRTEASDRGRTDHILDVTIQDQFLRLLKEMQRDIRMGLILVTHDLGSLPRPVIVLSSCTQGRSLKQGRKVCVQESIHPYTEALLAALPRLAREEKAVSNQGRAATSLEFTPRLQFLAALPQGHRQVQEAYPPMASCRDGRQAACWLVGEEA